MDKPELDFESYRDKQLTVEPFYGWGWGNGRGEPAEVPEPFMITLKSLFINQHNSLAGMGYIGSADHPLKQRWVVFSQRHLGSASLTERGTDFNISVLLAPPGVDENGVVFDNEAIESDDVIHGYAVIYLKK